VDRRVQGVDCASSDVSWKKVVSGPYSCVRHRIVHAPATYPRRQRIGSANGSIFDRIRASHVEMLIVFLLHKRNETNTTRNTVRIEPFYSCTSVKKFYLFFLTVQFEKYFQYILNYTSKKINSTFFVNEG